MVWGEVIQSAHRATNLVIKLVNEPLFGRGNRPVIAILSLSDTMSYISLLLGILRAGFIAFPISHGNSYTAVAQLLSQSEVTHLLFSPEKKVKDIVSAAMNNLSGESTRTDPFFNPEPLSTIDLDDIAVIYHTSDALTSKEQPQTISFGSRDLTGCVIACHAFPMIHAMGLFLLSSVVSTGFILSIFKPGHHVVPSPDNTLESAAVTKSDFIATTPSFVESWSRNPTDAERITKFSGIAGFIIFGGGPLSKEVGDQLTSKGVNIFIVYGLTQTMLVSKFISEPLGEDWEYFEVTPSREAYFMGHGNDEYEQPKTIAQV
ncbi:acetyl- synthetase [Pyrrhoderma noxium]|uniref:Acetyl-synthetase n=1 Tax=Pyrrhoderma noxium TaxID=2282107 RepID=A0A286UI47_9AGAM|nr:acetyl- synthetase [Pyrrhoderma noxium]